MANDTKLAVILHADVVGSTRLVQLDERVAHQRIGDAFQRFADVIVREGGAAREVRGDALVAEFERASDAITAAMNFQAENQAFNESLDGEIRPRLRIGISLGEVIVADGTVTGAGVVLAQRLEQLASADGICLSAAVREALPARLGVVYEDLGEQTLKGFEQVQRVFAVTGASSPAQEGPDSVQASGNARREAGEAFTGVTIAILPFDATGSDSDAVFLADGLTEDVTSAMSALHWLMVISRASAVDVASRTKDVRRIGEELGVQYAVTGTVRKAGERLRVTANLNDTRTGRQVWSTRIDRVVEDVFDILDDLARSIAAALTPELTSADLGKV